MIREFEAADMDAIIKIWLDASIIAHDFINESYWKGKADDMRNIYLPSAITYIYEDAEEILGFISMLNHFIAAIFVSPEAQGKGIGKQLINFAKSKYERLELAVFKENKRSIEFYEKQGFRQMSDTIDEDTGCYEIVMFFEKNRMI